MSDQNPYRSPPAEAAGKKNWPAILAHSIGAMLVLTALGLFFSRGIFDLNIFVLGVLLLAASSVRDLFFDTSERQLRREIKQRLADAAGEPKEETSPEEFLGRLEKE